MLIILHLSSTKPWDIHPWVIQQQMPNKALMKICLLSRANEVRNVSWPYGIVLLGVCLTIGLLLRRQNCGLSMRREYRERFLRHRIYRRPLISDPSMHHGTCVTHMPCFMSGSITRGGRENVPGSPGACETYNITYVSGQRPIETSAVHCRLCCLFQVKSISFTHQLTMFHLNMHSRITFMFTLKHAIRQI